MQELRDVYRTHGFAQVNGPELLIVLVEDNGNVITFKMPIVGQSPFETNERVRVILSCYNNDNRLVGDYSRDYNNLNRAERGALDALNSRFSDLWALRGAAIAAGGDVASAS